MARFGTETRTTSIIIMRTDTYGNETEIEVEATGTYSWDETGADVSDIEVEGGAEVADALTASEWDAIGQSLADAG